MKLFYTSVLSLLFHCACNATTWTVTVSNFQFSPATVNAVVGDVIQFNRQAGFHTTTCGAGLPGTSLPTGAMEWDSPMTSSVTTFSYTVTVAGTYNYGCTPHFQNGSGMVGTIIVSGVLAVNFGSFSANNINNNAVLQWQTYSEENTDYFSIRKSTDAVHFFEIGKVNASGSSNSNLAYQFVDKQLGGIYKYLYYEIVTVDKDKKESFSPIKTLRNNRVLKDILIVALSPNPVTRPGQVQIQFNADKAGEMNVSVFNSSGQLMLRTRMAAFYGLNNGHLHICDLGKGTYNIVFSMAGKREAKKVMVL